MTKAGIIAVKRQLASWGLAVTLALIGLTACGQIATDRAVDGVAATTTDDFTFDPGDKPDIRVHLLQGPGRQRNAQLLVVMTGVERNADDYRDDWAGLVRGGGVIVVVPEFRAEDYDSDAYNLGNMVNSQGDERPASEWTWPIIDDLVQTVRERTGAIDPAYSIFGHSAGGQFVTRFVQFRTGPALEAAVAANPGWYTMPVDEIDFPYGLRGIAADTEDLAPAYGSPFTLLLGANDTQRDANLRTTDEADAQGRNRLERGLRFFAESKRSAEQHSFNLAWRVGEVPGVGHDHTKMSRAAWSYLFPDSRNCRCKLGELTKPAS